jgi:hypothetical protein
VTPDAVAANAYRSAAGPLGANGGTAGGRAAAAPT